MLHTQSYNKSISRQETGKAMNAKGGEYCPVPFGRARAGVSWDCRRVPAGVSETSLHSDSDWSWLHSASHAPPPPLRQWAAHTHTQNKYRNVTSYIERIFWIYSQTHTQTLTLLLHTHIHLTYTEQLIYKNENVTKSENVNKTKRQKSWWSNISRLHQTKKIKIYKNRTYCTRPLINRHTANVRIRFSLFQIRVHAILNVAEETQYR